MGDEQEREMDEELFQEFEETMFADMNGAGIGKMPQTGCSAVGFQEVNVCIPVTIKPFGEIGNARTKCLGCAVIKPGCDDCPGKPGEVCRFTISQKLQVEVPVIFGARAESGETSVDCGCVGNARDCEACQR